MLELPLTIVIILLYFRYVKSEVKQIKDSNVDKPIFSPIKADIIVLADSCYKQLQLSSNRY